MMTALKLLLALGINLVAQRFGGAWGGPIAGMLIAAIMPTMAGRAAAVTAPLAAGGLLGAAAMQGAPLTEFAGRVAGNFGLPGWAAVAASIVLPSLQAGGTAGAIGGIRSLLKPPAKSPAA
jgi:hypothetical protein